MLQINALQRNFVRHIRLTRRSVVFMPSKECNHAVVLAQTTSAAAACAHNANSTRGFLQNTAADCVALTGLTR
jgi:hypothetical protein